MKKIALLAAALCVAMAAMAQTEEAYPSYIQVTGRAEKEVVPDEFYLSITLDERDSKGRLSVESQRRDMIAALKRLGIDIEKQLKVANLSSEFFRRNTSVATAKYQLLLHSAAEVSKAWQTLDKLGISDVVIQRVSHSQLETMKEQVRVEAIRNARRSAETLAEAIGQKAGKCFYIWDSNSDIMPAYYDNAVSVRSMKLMDAAGAEEFAEEEELDFKTIKLHYNVQTKFVLE